MPTVGAIDFESLREPFRRSLAFLNKEGWRILIFDLIFLILLVALLFMRQLVCASVELDRLQWLA